MAKTVFYRFHYDRDVHRVQLVRNINALEGQTLLNAQEWESVRRRGDAAIKTWIKRLLPSLGALVGAARPHAGGNLGPLKSVAVDAISQELVL